MSTHYEVLNVPENATTERIKQRFQQLILEHHPDKRSNENDDAGMTHRILQAWEVLRDPKRRTEYDVKLQAGTKSITINAEVDLDDMDYDNAGTYSTECRCSGVYAITEEALEQGRDIVYCDQCSLRIRVLYDVLEEA